MAISDDFTINYTNKTITHSSGTTVYEMYQMYSWLMDEVDDSDTIDDTVPMTAQTPTAYTLTNSWFIDETSIQYLTGGSLKTNGWASGEILMISFNASTTSFSSSDIGLTITGGTTGDTGTVLFYDSRYGTDLGVVWIRPDDPATDTFDNPTEDFLVTGPYADGVFTNTFDTNGGRSGENIWTNIYTLGTIISDTQIYVVQDTAKITPWWSTGHIDILLKVQEGGELVDEGYVNILARHYSKSYDHFISDLSGGSRTPIPLATFDDSNNDSGYRTFTGNNGTGTFQVGEIIKEDADTEKQGIVTSVGGTGAAPILEYYLIGYPQTDFVDTDDITGQTSNATCDVNGAPGNTGPITTSGITFNFGATSQDLSNGNGSRPYDVVVNCANNSLTDVYEYLKYITRRGSSTSLNGHDGEQYTAVGEQRLIYESMSGSFTEGNSISGGTSSATAVIVSDHTGDTVLVVRDIVGIFVEGETLTEGANTADISTGGIENISPVKQSPFATYAGSKLFAARGVWLSNVKGAEANDYELIDSENVRQVPPQTIAITVSNTIAGDRVSVFRTTGGEGSETIDKEVFTSHASNNTSGGTNFVVQSSIFADTPSSGVIRIPQRNPSGIITSEDRYEYSSWSGTSFTLSGSVALKRTYDSNDTAYVPYIDRVVYETSASQTITYVDDRYVLTRVRIVGIIPFKVAGEIDTGGLTVTTIRSTDSIYQ